MTCPYAHDDGAYVLGALAPAARGEFKDHLAGCEECSASVAGLAGLPGLLGRVDPAVLEEPLAEEPPPTLLPALSAKVRQEHRRRTFTLIGLAAAAVVVAAVPVAVWQLGGDEPPPGDDSSVAPPLDTREMQPVGEVPVRATMTLEDVTWGTKLGLTCTYDPDSVDYELPPEVDYTLFVRSRTGKLERVGSWRSVGGRRMQLEAATALMTSDLDSVEVRTANGRRVVLRLVT